MDEETSVPRPEGRSGVVAVVGRTNVGKSTLLNALLGEKVSIVSDTVQTTRNVIRAILTEDRGQLVFLDTPGVHKAEGEMGKNLNKMARSSVGGADAVLLVLDASRKTWQEDEGWMRRLMKDDTPCVLLFNKTDLIPRHEIKTGKRVGSASCIQEPVVSKREDTPSRVREGRPTTRDEGLGSGFIASYKELWARVAEEKECELKPVWLEASALKGEGLSALTDTLFSIVPEGPYLFDGDMLTDYPRKLNIADVIREKLFLRLHDELPHALAVWVETIDEKEKGWTIEADVYVERHSQKGIVIGAKGRLLKSVQYEAGKELNEMYGVPVKVKIWVKVEKNWRKNFWVLKKLGYA